MKGKALQIIGLSCILLWYPFIKLIDWLIQEIELAITGKGTYYWSIDQTLYITGISMTIFGIMLCIISLIENKKGNI